MAYIGKQPIVGNFQVCDAISVVNGQAAYTMQVNSTNVTPETAFHMLVSLNGVLQKPGSSFTISGSTITFASNLATGDVIDFIILLGDVLNIGTPSDDTVATASIQANAITAAKLNNDIISGLTALTSAPADTDEFLISDAGTIKRIDASLVVGGGKVLQLVEGTKTDAFSTTNTSSHQATGLSVDITPSATTSKVLILASFQVTNTVDGEYADIALKRGSSFIGGSNTLQIMDGHSRRSQQIMLYLDTPSSTSSLTYEVYMYTSGGGSTSQLNGNSLTARILAIEIGA